MEKERTITLPSGATCKVKCLTAQDILEFGRIPNIFADLQEAAKFEKIENQGLKPEDIDKMESVHKYNEILIARCVGIITKPDGSEYEVVPTPWKKCKDGEVNCHVWLLSDDGKFAMNQISELSGTTKAATDAARPFPNKQECGDSTVPTGQVLSLPSQSVD